jgi:anti-sigma-K factor RskA
LVTTEPDPDMMAAELVLGLLEPGERAVAMRRVLSDRDFAREVEWWRLHLAQWLEEYPAIPAPEGIAERIVASQAARSRGRVRWIAPALVAVAAAILLIVVQRPAQTPAPQPLATAPTLVIAALAPSDKSISPIAATVNTGTGEIRVASSRLAPAGKAAELWVIHDGTPHAIGLLTDGKATRLTASPVQRAYLRPDSVLAISIEPPGGSPIATPTGPVVATGPLAAT